MNKKEDILNESQYWKEKKVIGLNFVKENLIVIYFYYEFDKGKVTPGKFKIFYFIISHFIMVNQNSRN